MNRTRPSLLIVEDDVPTLEALATLLRHEGFSVRKATSLAEARRAARRRHPDVVITDLRLPDGEGTELVEELSADGSEVVVVTGHASVDTAVEALRRGAYDYLTKPVDEKRLKAILTRLGKTLELKAQVRSLRGELKRLGRFGPMVGTSKTMQTVYRLIESVAATDTSVLLVGESGTGKELAAQALHDLSPRHDEPMVAVNCGAVTATLVESELFGHERGAFTGATGRHRGFFERASGGTLLLDEITEMSLDLQVKLLRVLETGQIQRVGGSKPIGVDVRVVAATNRQPEQAVEEGVLREDLYYRLNVFRIELPPLRDRKGDVPLLVRHFLDELGREDVAIGAGAIRALEGHDWPGNVRELRNALEHAAVLADDEITAASLPASVRTPAAHEIRSGEADLGIRPGMPIADAERRLILATLDELDNNKTRTAETLGISLKTLYNRLKKYRSE